MPGLGDVLGAVGGAVGGAAGGFSEALYRLMLTQQEERYQQERLAQQDEIIELRRESNRIGANEARARLGAEGVRLPEYVSRDPSMQRGLDDIRGAGARIGSAPPSMGMAAPTPGGAPPAFQGQRLGMAAGQPMEGGFSAAFQRMTGGEPRIAAPPVRTLAEGGYDPSRDMRVVRGREEFRLGQMEDEQAHARDLALEDVRHDNRRDLEGLRQQGRGGGAGDPGSNQVTRRQRALAAARAVASIQEDLADRGRAPDPGSVSKRVGAVLQPFGFRSVAELSQEMRELGMSDADVQSAPTPTIDDRIDELVLEGRTNEEIRAILQEEGYVGGG